MDFQGLLWLVTYLAAFLSSLVEPTELHCPNQCICLSSTQVLCNGGGLTQIPDDLPTSVEHLSLTKNKISELPTDAFRRFKRLRKLYLDGNAITSIKQFAFRGLSHLQELSVQNTPLKKLGQFTFSGLFNLSSLYLANNQIRRIEAYAFAGTSSVRFLVLSNNPTMQIDSAAFSGLRDVQMIYLPTGIRRIEADAFNGLQNVGHLRLPHLDLDELSSFVFRGLRNAQLLTIQESDLGTIQRNAFANMTNISRLSLLNNKIDKIEEIHITAQNRITSLHLIGNHVLDIPPSASLKINGVPDCVMNKNHFPCDCRLFWLLESSLVRSHKRGHSNGSYTKKEEDFLSTNFCISPNELHGQSLTTALQNPLLSRHSPCQQPSPVPTTVTTAADDVTMSAHDSVERDTLRPRNGKTTSTATSPHGTKYLQLLTVVLLLSTRLRCVSLLVT